MANTTLRIEKSFSRVTSFSVVPPLLKINVRLVIVSDSYLEPSRRDDIISLLYLLVYLINGQNYWLQGLNKGERGYFKKVGQIKKFMNAESLCVHDAICL